MDLCLGTDKDEDYSKFLPGKIAESIIRAHSKLQPAKAGWSVFDGSDYTKQDGGRFGLELELIHLVKRQFGQHASRLSKPKRYRETGPTDPWFTLFSLVSENNQPIAVLEISQCIT